MTPAILRCGSPKTRTYRSNYASCVYCQTTIGLLPALQAQRDDAAAKQQTERAEPCARLLADQHLADQHMDAS